MQLRKCFTALPAGEGRSFDRQRSVAASSRLEERTEFIHALFDRCSADFQLLLLFLVQLHLNLLDIETASSSDRRFIRGVLVIQPRRFITLTLGLKVLAYS